ncbi:MAG: cytochrome b/b6 domain-containing protein [Clostridiales bacterium]|jgi:Ni/Fe-hydrogenase 1 B-type cytochrome subunit|nr:cytochrome b/b6 domain-containing protein [Clostridiales bacterium]
MLFKRLHQPWEIRVFHWLFTIVITIKLWSGFYISFPHPAWGFNGMYSARMTHALMTPTLAALLTFRIYFALLTRDWRQIFIWRRLDFKQIRPWLRYFLFLDDETPIQEKYSIAQRLIFTAMFLTMPVFYTTGVIMLNIPFFRWLNVFYGGQGISRIVHYLFSVFLLAIIAVHVYLAMTTSIERLRAMFSGYLHHRKIPGSKEGEEN